MMSKLEELIQRYCPDGVEYLPLGEVCRLERGKGFSKSDISAEGRPIILYGELYTTYREYIEVIFSHTTSSTKTVVSANKGDLLLPLSSTTKEAQIGKASVLCVDEVIIGGDAIILHHNQNPGYLMYLINSCWFEAYKMKCVSGTTIMHLSPSKFSLLSIPIPPLPIQEEIARVLDTFTELQAELQAELQKRLQQYNYYRDYLLSFGGRADVEWKKLGDMAVIGDGLHGTPKYSSDTGYYFINGNNLHNGIIVFDDNTKQISEEEFERIKVDLDDNTLLMSINGTVGNLAYYKNEHVALSKSAAYFKVNPCLISKEYLYYYLQSVWAHSYFELVQTGSTIKNLGLKSLREMKIPVPHHEEQKKLVDILERFHTLNKDFIQGLPAEIEKRRQQYEFYRDKLLTFKRKES